MRMNVRAKDRFPDREDMFRFGEGAASSIIEARRREIADLLEEIRAREPTSAEVARAIAQASEGELKGPKLAKVAARVVALFKAG